MKNNENAKMVGSLKKNLGACALAIVSIFLASGCSVARVAVHQSWFDQPSHRIAVLPLASEGTSGKDVSAALVTELVNSGFSIMERTDFEQVLREQKLQYTGAVDSQTAVEAGQLAGADFIVVGSVSLRTVAPTANWLGNDGESTQIDQVNVRWVNVKNGQVMASVSVKNTLGGTAEDVAMKISKALQVAVAPSSSYAAASSSSAYQGRPDPFDFRGR